jgi:hypothetical protein
VPGVGFYDHGDPPAQWYKRTITQRAATAFIDAFDRKPAEPKSGSYGIQDGQTIWGDC